MLFGPRVWHSDSMTNTAIQASCTLGTAGTASIPLRRRQRGCGEQTPHETTPVHAYANLVWIMSGFSCHSSFSTHICSLRQLDLVDPSRRTNSPF
jgi:hypothetical protein